MKKAIKIVGAIVLVVILAAFGLIYSGWYDVGASSHEPQIVQWILETVRDRSVSRHSKGILAPDLRASEMITEGFEHYREMCAVCHGAPDQAPTAIAQGLNPPAPNLGVVANDSTPAELFWVTKNGIRMTGMPSFGVTHSDDQIWMIVAFLERMRTLTAAEYEAMSAAAGSNRKEHE